MIFTLPPTGQVMEMKDALERYIREEEDSTNVATGSSATKGVDSSAVAGGGGGAVELDDYPPEFVCPISHDLMDNPVVCADGISYSEADIREWRVQDQYDTAARTRPHAHLLNNSLTHSHHTNTPRLNRGHSTSPLTGAELAHLHLTPNYALKSQITRWRDEHKQ